MRLFSLLPSKEQSAHSARVKAVGGEAQRQLRQQDVVVISIPNLTNSLLTAEVYKSHIRLKVSRGPLRVRRAQIAEIAEHLDTLWSQQMHRWIFYKKECHNHMGSCFNIKILIFGIR